MGQPRAFARVFVAALAVAAAVLPSAAVVYYLFRLPSSRPASDEEVRTLISRVDLADRVVARVRLRRIVVLETPRTPKSFVDTRLAKWSAWRKTGYFDPLSDGDAVAEEIDVDVDYGVPLRSVGPEAIVISGGKVTVTLPAPTVINVPRIAAARAACPPISSRWGGGAGGFDELRRAARARAQEQAAAWVDQTRPGRCGAWRRARTCRSRYCQSPVARMLKYQLAEGPDRNDRRK